MARRLQTPVLEVDDAIRPPVAGNEDGNLSPGASITDQSVNRTTTDLNNDTLSDRDTEELVEILECPVCLQPSVHPVRLPCSHVFCFLCVKGVASHGQRCCALCRSAIPPGFLTAPALVDDNAVKLSVTAERAIDGKFQWFYEGVRGWWQYDPRAARELEEKFQSGEKQFELMIAGFMYIVDIENSVQYRREHPNRRRRIKRDLVDIPDRKGVAGIVCRPSSAERSGGDGGEERRAARGAPTSSNRASSLQNPLPSLGPSNQLRSDISTPHLTTATGQATVPSTSSPVVPSSSSSTTLVDQSVRSNKNINSGESNAVPVDTSATHTARRSSRRRGVEGVERQETDNVVNSDSLNHSRRRGRQHVSNTSAMNGATNNLSDRLAGISLVPNRVGLDGSVVTRETSIAEGLRHRRRPAEESRNGRHPTRTSGTPVSQGGSNTAPAARDRSVSPHTTTHPATSPTDSAGSP